MIASDGTEVITVPTNLPIAQLADTDNFELMVAELNASERKALTSILADIRCGRDRTVAETDEITSLLIQAAEKNQPTVAPGLLTAAFKGLNNDTYRKPEGDRIINGLQAALDQTYFETIEDGTVWNSNDFQAFYRSLEIATDGVDGFRGDPIYVGVVPLLEQSIVYRGRRVKMTGQVVQSEAITAQPNEFGIKSYWMIWLRPFDGSEQPVVAYTQTIPNIIQNLNANQTKDKGPTVELDGVFLKRHLYQSNSGYEQAPLLVAKVAVTHQPVAITSTETGNPPIGWIFLAAFILGVGAALAVYRYCTKSDLRHRQLRELGTKNSVPFFDELEVKA